MLSDDLYQAKSEIASLRAKIQQKTLVKRELELDLQALNHRVRTGGWLRREEYVGICRKQKALKTKILDVEKEIAPIKAEIWEWGAIEASLYAETVQRTA